LTILRTAARPCAAPAPARAARAALAALAALALGGGAGAAAAHDGHDHGERPSAAAPGGGPRFAAEAGPFELVGALDGRRLVLWLDRADDTAPITGATIELDVGGRSTVAVPEGEVYVVELDAAPAPGVLPVAATIVAGADADVIAAELRIDPPTAPADRAPPGTGVAGYGPVALAAAGVGIALVAGALGWAAGRRRGTARG
jgi:hypothetical protein